MVEHFKLRVPKHQDGKDKKLQQDHQVEGQQDRVLGFELRHRLVVLVKVVVVVVAEVAAHHAASRILPLSSPWMEVGWERKVECYVKGKISLTTRFFLCM